MSVSLAPAVRLAGALLATDTVPEDSQVSPGLIGFLATFAVALVTVLLLLDLTRRLRRMKHRQEVAEREALEQAHTVGEADEPGRTAGQPVDPEDRDEHDR